MGSRGRPPILSREEISWAYDKWCEGYTHQEIADALYVSRVTVQSALKGRQRIRKKPPLVYPGKLGA